MATKRELIITKGCLTATGVTLLIPAIMLLDGYIVSKMWLWFVVPFGIMPITVWHAYGLCLCISLFSRTDLKKDEGWKPVLTGLVKRGLTILTSYLVYTYGMCA
jgi:hypothetical protein